MKVLLKITIHEKKNVLILGVSGQDGSYLAHYLIKNKYKVIGVSRKNAAYLIILSLV